MFTLLLVLSAVITAAGVATASCHHEVHGVPQQMTRPMRLHGGLLYDDRNLENRLPGSYGTAATADVGPKRQRLFYEEASYIQHGSVSGRTG